MCLFDFCKPIYTYFVLFPLFRVFLFTFSFSFFSSQEAVVLLIATALYIGSCSSHCTTLSGL